MKPLCLLFLLTVTVLAEMPPSLSNLEAKYKADMEAASAAQDADVDRAGRTYLGVLETAEKSSLAVSDMKPLAAIAAERDGLKNRNLAGAPPADLPKSLAVARKSYFASVAKADTDHAPRKQRINADYLRSLTTLESQFRTDAAAMAEIAAEKNRVIHGDPVGMAAITKKFTGTTWRNYGGSVMVLEAGGAAHTKLGVTGTWKVIASDRLEFNWTKQRGREEWTVDAAFKTLHNVVNEKKLLADYVREE